MVKNFFVAVVFLGLVAVSAATDDPKPLTIGDPIPSFKVAGWAKGKAVSDLKKGNIYVVEFWATWCGPCIASMPHLSEMAKKFEGKATFVSINTWDFAKGTDGKPEDKDTHTNRVANWVKDNDAKMQYNVAYDDDKDTMSTTWMRAAGRNGIPCAFIVNADRQITWIGHPMQMEKVLDQVVSNTWDMKAFKETFAAEAARAKEAAELRKKMLELAKADDMAGFEALMTKIEKSQAISNILGAPNFAIKVIEKYAGKVEGLAPSDFCSMLSYISGNKEATSETKATALKVSEMCFNDTPAGAAALSAAYHAKCLFNNGKKDEALVWIERAAKLLDSYSPESARPGIAKFIENAKKSFGS